MIQNIDIVRELEASAAWRNGLLTTAKGEPRALLANVLHALRHCPDWRGVLRYNQLTATVEAERPTPWRHTGPWSDQQDVLLCEWLQHQGVNVNVIIAGQAAQSIGRERQYHPIRDWLKGLDWDCRPRLGSWLSTYLGVEPTPYSDAVGRCALIGAVARAMNPGCKVDTLLILEGAQGIGKSQVCAILGHPWFRDEIADLGSKDASLQLNGAWLVELSELDAMSRSETAKVKAFLSRQTDSYRPPYGRNVIDQPRSAWFIGTTNSTGYLRDETGARRFWPVKCGRIDLSELRADRNQLMAEARVMYEAGARWWLQDEQLMADATEQQAERYDGDPWQEVINKWLLSASDDVITVERILSSAIRKSQEHWTQQDKLRVCRCMRAAGWTYTRRRVHGTRTYLFARTDGTEGGTE